MHVNGHIPLPPSLDRKVFLSTWKDIPSTNEYQSMVQGVSLTADQAEAKLNANNIFTIARRVVDDQELMYMSAKFVNGIWLLAEIKIMVGSPIAVSLVLNLSACCRGLGVL